jgi:hypothetical protein
MTHRRVQALNKSTTPVDKPEDIFGLSPLFPYFTREIHHCLIFRLICNNLKLKETFLLTCQVFENKDSFVTDL